MTHHLAVLAFTALANLALGAIVLIRDPHNRINQAFGLFSSAVAAWTFSNGLVNLYAADSSGILWARLTFAAASIIPLSFLMFARAFPLNTSPSRDILSTIFFVTGVLMFLVSFTPAIAVATTSHQNVLHVSYGYLHPLFGFYFVAALGYSLFILGRKFRTLKGLEKLQIRYVLMAVALAGIGATATNLIIPLVFQSSRFSSYGPVFSLLMIALIAHSIIRYRLMNIRLVIRRGVAYLLAVTAASAVFVLSAIAASRLLFSPPELPPWVQLSLALLIALLFQPLRDRIQNLLNSYFFREPYDYQRVIREISRTMAKTLDLNSLLEYACDAIARTVRPESITIFTIDEVGSTYKQLVRRCSIETPDIDTERSYPAAAPLPLFLSNTKRHAVRHELSSRLPSPSAALQDLRRAGAECALPIVEGDKVAGFFLLGPKLSGDPYFAEDLDLLTTLVGQAAIAIKNAQLYSQVLLINEYVDNILTTMDSAVVAIAADGSVTLFNAGARRLTGLNVTDLRGMSLEQLPSSLAALLKATLHDSEPRIQIESLVQDSEGNSTPTICSTSPLKDRNGAVLGVVAVFSDLTRLKKLEEEKRQAERLASVGALASGLAHEIKNPLVAIKTFAELLPERFVDEDFRSDFSKVVIREIDRIDDLIARLRGLAAPQTQQLIPLDIRVPIDETIALLRGQLEQTGIRVKTEYGPQLPLVAGDLPQLKQLFLNLFINSLESMRSDGELTIRIADRSTFAQRTVFVEIQDTGPGIPAAMLTKIFDPFVTTKQRGSGLGLSISRGIADAHRASIQARNRTNHSGAVILIEFPALNPDSSTDVSRWPDFPYPEVSDSHRTIRSTHPTR